VTNFVIHFACDSCFCLFGGCSFEDGLSATHMRYVGDFICGLLGPTGRL
jgi:hypothetical protein